MKKSLISVSIFAGAVLVSSAASAASFADQMNNCLERHANTRDKATVLLECDAQGGKLTNCKAVENNASKSFEKAAVCVAEAMPMPGKTGLIRVPFRFPGDS